MSEIFYNKKKNWYLFAIKLIVFFNVIGILVLILSKKEVTITNLLLYTTVSLLFILIIYLQHIKAIIFLNNELIISKSCKTYRDPLKYFSVRESKKVRGMNIRYNQLIISNWKQKKEFKIL